MSCPSSFSGTVCDSHKASTAQRQDPPWQGEALVCMVSSHRTYHNPYKTKYSNYLLNLIKGCCCGGGGGGLNGEKLNHAISEIKAHLT